MIKEVSKMLTKLTLIVGRAIQAGERLAVNRDDLLSSSDEQIAHRYLNDPMFNSLVKHSVHAITNALEEFGGKDV